MLPHMIKQLKRVAKAPDLLALQQSAVALLECLPDELSLPKLRLRPQIWLRQALNGCDCDLLLNAVIDATTNMLQLLARAIGSIKGSSKTSEPSSMTAHLQGPLAALDVTSYMQEVLVCQRLLTIVNIAAHHLGCGNAAQQELLQEQLSRAGGPPLLLWDCILCNHV